MASYQNPTITLPFFLRAFTQLGDSFLVWLNQTLLWEYSSPFPGLSSAPCLVVCWHSRLLMLPFLYPKERRAVALVSPSRDGEILSLFLQRRGREVIRGSSRRGAFSATAKILDYLERGYDVAVTLDGPTGPREKAKPGLIHLAIKYNIPLFPISYTPSLYLTLPTWDRLLLPLPYSRALVQYHPLFSLPPDLPREEGVFQVESALNRLAREGAEWRKRNHLKKQAEK